MVKPAPTRTKSKAPVSLSPVKALSGSLPAEPAMPKPAVSKPAASKPAAAPAPAPKPAETPEAAEAAQPAEKPRAAAATPSVKPAPAKPAAAKPAAAKPVTAAPAAKTPAPVSAPAGKAAAKPPAARAPVKVAARAAAPAQVVSPPAAKAMPARPEAPVVPVVAAPAAPAPQAVAKAVEQVASAAVEAATVATTTVTKLTERTIEAAAVKVEAKPVPGSKPAPSLAAIPLPRPPEFAAIATGTVMTQTLAMAKAFGALQASMLDHACSELKARLGEAETLARTDSAADAVALQAKAVRRSYDSYAEHLKELARIAGQAIKP